MTAAAKGDDAPPAVGGDATPAEPEREVRFVEPVPGAAPAVGAGLWAMQEARRGLLTTVKALDPRVLDWRGPSTLGSFDSGRSGSDGSDRGGFGTDNAVGALLYHIALIEMSWLYDDILLEDVPDDIAELFPEDHRTPDGRLARAEGQALETHMARLARTRGRFLERVAPMSEPDWNRLRRLPGEDYACTPAWVVFHLVEHEAGHTFQVREIARRWRDQAAEP